MPSILESNTCRELRFLERVGYKNVTSRIKYLTRRRLALSALADNKKIRTFAKQSTERVTQQTVLNEEKRPDRQAADGFDYGMH